MGNFSQNGSRTHDWNSGCGALQPARPYRYGGDCCVSPSLRGILLCSSPQIRDSLRGSPEHRDYLNRPEYSYHPPRVLTGPLFMKGDCPEAYGTSPSQASLI